MVTMNCEEKDVINHTKGNCQGQKGQVWFIITYFCILYSSIEVMQKCIASYSFSEGDPSAVLKL